MQDVLHSLKLEHLGELFEKEDITMDILVDMTSEDLQTIEVAAFGHRRKILKKVKELNLAENRPKDCNSLTGMVCSSFIEQTFYFSS